MSGFFAPQDSHQEPWFRIGRLEVTTVVLVILVALLAGLGWVGSSSLPARLAYSPELVASGQVWRVVTWPFAMDLSLWSVITLALFWYFGTDLEHLIGRTRMAWLLLGMWASLTAAYTVVALIAGGSGLGGLDFIEFLLLLLWVAEYPSRPFIFGIPAWVVGAILVAVRVFGLLAYRDMSGLLSLLFSFILVAIVARAVGLLGEYPWIPGRVVPGRPVKARGGPHATRTNARQASRHASDRDRLDGLLDQINDKGIGSLSEAQRRELMKLRERLRRQ